MKPDIKIFQISETNFFLKKYKKQKQKKKLIILAVKNFMTHRQSQ